MASVGYESNEDINVELSLENKATLDETISQAELSLQSPEVLNQSLATVAENECLDEAAAAMLQITMVVGALKNQTKGPLHIGPNHVHIFSGYIVKKFPNPLESAGGFAISSVFNKGVKAAVVYSGKNKAGIECGWLLAFGDTKAGRKVYVDCGNIVKFNNINWGEVERKLDHAGTIGRALDKDTGTSIYASIAGSSGKSVVGAVFFG